MKPGSGKMTQWLRALAGLLKEFSSQHPQGAAPTTTCTPAPFWPLEAPEHTWHTLTYTHM